MKKKLLCIARAECRHPDKPKIGIRASQPNEIWHIDTTRIRLLDGSSLWIHPHSLSYFNELAGGPQQGHRYLLDGNIDWGQDVFYLKKWCDAHPDARPITITSHFSPVEPKRFGLENTANGTSHHPGKKSAHAAGWYAVNVHTLFSDESRYEALRRKYRPIAKAGYSIWVYHVTDTERRY